MGRPYSERGRYGIYAYGRLSWIHDSWKGWEGGLWWRENDDLDVDI